MHKIGQSGQFVFVGNVLKPLTKSVLIPLGLTGETSATDGAIHKNCLGLVIRQ